MLKPKSIPVEKQLQALRQIDQNFQNYGIQTGLTEQDFTAENLTRVMETLNSLSHQHAAEQGVHPSGEGTALDFD